MICIWRDVVAGNLELVSAGAVKPIENICPRPEPDMTAFLAQGVCPPETGFLIRNPTDNQQASKTEIMQLSGRRRQLAFSDGRGNGWAPPRS